MMAGTPRADRQRPLLAVVYDRGSASPSTIVSAARRACDVVFVCDAARPRAAENLAAVRGHAGVIDVTGLRSHERVAAVRAASPDGILTFSEHQLGATAEIAAGLGLPFHDRDTVAVLTDKLAQRRALSRAGVDATRSAIIDRDAAAALDAVGLPAVVKPRGGAGSADTMRVDTREEYAAAVGALAPGTPFVLEELLDGDPSVAGACWGDYVSVESVSTPAGCRQICVTGKLPLAEPFRETGMFLPCTLSDGVMAEVLNLERAALRALGVRYGVTHTEIKLTANGPRLIEVNGRIGGYVPEILRRASGIDLVRLAIQVALGGEPTVPAARHREVTYQLFLAPPAEMRVLKSLDGIDDVAALPHVRNIEVRATPGQALDWRDGTEGHLGVVYGSTPDHAALRDAVESILATVRPRYGRTLPAMTRRPR